MGGEVHILKRLPRIKFPQRHPKSSNSGGSTSHSQQHESTKSKSPGIAPLGSDVPAPPMNTAVGGRAALQPERTPVTASEIEAILLGGCI